MKPGGAKVSLTMKKKIVAVYSSKGGVGKSFLAFNLAAAFHLETSGKVLWLDFSAPFSRDAGRMANIEKLRYLTPLLPVAKSVKDSVLASYPVKGPGGVFFAGLMDGEPKTAGLPEQNQEHLQVLINKFADQFDFVIIDTGFRTGTLLEVILNSIDQVIVPMESRPLSIARALDDIAMLRQKNIAMPTLHPVLNKYHPKATIQPRMIEKRLGKSLAAVMPWDESASDKMTSGKSYPADYPNHEIAKAISQLAVKVFHAGLRGKKQRRPVVPDEELAERQHQALKEKIHDELLERTDLRACKFDSATDMDALRTTLQRHIATTLDREARELNRETRVDITREILQEALGLGPLEDLLDDPTISEIMVNRFDEIYVERQGLLTPISRKFISEKQLLGIIERIFGHVNRRIDLNNPMEDARLADGSRVNAIIPPLAVKGASLTIRKFSKDMVAMEQLLANGTLGSQMAEFMKAAVTSRLNIVISGGTGTGKTTLLNILSDCIPTQERIITIEDSAELQLRQPHVVTLESRPKSLQQKGEVTIRDLVKNALRMRPDRIIVGECRSGETLDMLQAMNTGHDGSMTTIHANSPREMLSRLETLVMFAGFELPSRAIKEQITGAVDCVVQLSRFKDGTRKITSITEVIGMEG